VVIERHRGRGMLAVEACDQEVKGGVIGCAEEAGGNPLRALDMRATVDREEFFAFQHGDGRLQLIERLAAAYRAGELPDYMLEFVYSLRTRTMRTTS
jgi:hypothetical protein